MRIALSSRVQLLLGASALTILPRPEAAFAESTAAATITDKVRLEFIEQVSAQESRTLPMVIGLFGKDAPSSVETFKKAAASQLDVKCPASVDLSDEIMERGKQSKKAALKGCLGNEFEPVSYAYSQIWSIEGGKRINAGAVQGKFALRLAPTAPTSESASLSHDAPGLLSVRRGGGAFDFHITTAANAGYDSDYAVIGRVIEGMDSVMEIDKMPTVKAAEVFGIEDPSASRSMKCEYNNPNPFCAQSKPLRKVTLIRAAVL